MDAARIHCQGCPLSFGNFPFFSSPKIPAQAEEKKIFHRIPFLQSLSWKTPSLGIWDAKPGAGNAPKSERGEMGLQGHRDCAARGKPRPAPKKNPKKTPQIGTCTPSNSRKSGSVQLRARRNQGETTQSLAGIKSQVKNPPSHQKLLCCKRFKLKTGMMNQDFLGSSKSRIYLELQIPFASLPQPQHDKETAEKKGNDGAAPRVYFIFIYN